jgi:hypothetical protein
MNVSDAAAATSAKTLQATYRVFIMAVPYPCAEGTIAGITRSASEILSGRYFHVDPMRLSRGSDHTHEVETVSTVTPLIQGPLHLKLRYFTGKSRLDSKMGAARIVETRDATMSSPVMHPNDCRRRTPLPGSAP